jgi:hypothetical protein
VIALLRYALTDILHGQRWVAPVVALGLVDAVVSAQAGSLLPTFAVLATAMLFIGTWLTVVVVNNEDPVQQSITETCAGGGAKVRLSKLLFAFLSAVFLGLLAMVPPIAIAPSGLTAKDLLAGASGLVIAALAAVGLGSLCSRPIVRRHAWSVLAGILVGMATVLIPNGVPSRQLLVLFNKTGHVALAVPILLIGLETLALCVVAVVASLRVSASRS